MDDIRKRLFVIVGIIVGVLLALVLLSVVLAPKASNTPTSTAEQGTNLPTPKTPVIGTSATPINIGTVPTSTPEELYVAQLAKVFVERFGSYSNQNGNEHIAEVLQLSSVRMQTYVQSAQLTFNSKYQGMTTTVVASRIVKKTATAATVAVDVQRVLSATSTTETQYQSGTVQLIQESGTWKVDGLFWSK